MPRIGSVSFLLLASLFSSAVIATEKPHLKVGVVLPLSGAQASYGVEAAQGMEMALETIRQRDPELARSITIIKEDEKSNPIEATAAAKKLLNIDKVDLIFGSLASSNTLAMAASVVASGKPLVTPGSTNPEVTEKSDLIFRTCFIDSFQGSVMARYALGQLGKKKAAILLDHKSDYSKGLADSFAKTFKAGGGEIVATEAYEAGKREFKTQLIKIRKANPEVLFVPGYYQEAGVIMKQAKQIGYQITMLGGDGWDSPTLFALAGPGAAQGHYFSTHFSADDKDREVQQFVKSYQGKYQKAPSGIVALGYDGMMVVANAFKRANSTKAEDLKKALSSIKQLRSVTGNISINAARDVEKDAVVLRTEGQGAVFSHRVSSSGEIK